MDYPILQEPAHIVEPLRYLLAKIKNNLDTMLDYNELRVVLEEDLLLAAFTCINQDEWEEFIRLVVEHRFGDAAPTYQQMQRCLPPSLFTRSLAILMATGSTTYEETDSGNSDPDRTRLNDSEAEQIANEDADAEGAEIDESEVELTETLCSEHEQSER